MSRRGIEALHTLNKSKRSKEEKDVDEEWTKDWMDNLDDLTKFGLSLGMAALLGMTVTNLKTGGIALILLLASSGAAKCTKIVGKLFKNKNDKLKKKILRFGFLLSAAFAATGIMACGIYFAEVFEVRLGIEGCGGLSTTMTNRFLAWGGLGGSLIFLSALFVVCIG